jgi:hypothetical protein
MTAEVPLPEDSKRNKDLHSKFPEIPVSELLINDYMCALKRGGAWIQGRIYLTKLRVAFHSSILGIIHRVRVLD